MEDISTIIEDSITDAELSAPADDTTEPTETPLEASSDPVEDTALTDDPAPSTEPAAAPQDDFDKKFGLTSQSSSGRENRIPYSRVKKITEKAISDAKSSWSKELETGYVPLGKYAEADAKVRDYEGRLAQVAEFERVMEKEPERFLQMLYRQPGYAQLFDQLAAPAAAPEPEPVPQATQFSESMPEPDQALSDGSKVYSLDGLKALLAWQKRETEATTVEKVMKQVEARYAPIESSFNSYQRVQSVIPHVQRQIADARSWELFNENEEEIVKVLQAHKDVSLERAYQHVVFPKLKAERERLTSESKVNRETMRAELLKELKQAPRSTSVASGPSRPAPVNASSGPRALEDVIQESIKAIR